MKKKVILLSKIPSPYRIPLFKLINQHTEIELMSVYLAETQPNRLWRVSVGSNGYRELVLNGKQIMIKKLSWPVHFTMGIWGLLKKERPDVVITTGYESIAYWQALLYTRLYKCRFVLWSGAILKAIHVNKGPINWLRKLFIRSSDGILAYGSESNDMLIAYGANPKKIVVSRNTVDMQYISGRVREETKGSGLRIGDSDMNILFIGQLLKRKGVRELLEGLAKAENQNIRLKIVGDGVEWDNLFRLTETLNLTNQVEFVGYKQYEELIPFLVWADVLAMPSLEEIWGLVINEALAAGLPVIASVFAGSTTDLVDINNGIRINPNNIEELTQAITDIYNQIDHFRKNREKIMSDAINRASLDNYANSFVKVVIGE